MKISVVYILTFYGTLKYTESAKILAVFPTPSISHQIVFRPLMLELAKRGHQVTEITTDPASLKQPIPANLTEIDVHNVSYKLWKEYAVTHKGNEKLIQNQLKTLLSVMLAIFKAQFQSEQVQKLINDKTKKFDLLFVEHSAARPTLCYSFLYNVPVISFNSFGGIFNTFDTVDVTDHPLIYPKPPIQKFNNLTTIERLYQLYSFYVTKYVYDAYEIEENRELKRIFGPEIPDLSDLKKNIHMTFLNSHSIWDNNRPVPLNVIYVGGIHLNPANDLPKDLKSYLDKSSKGVIYLSFGSNLITSLLPTDKIKLFNDVFSELSYNVLLKWNEDIPEWSNNVKSGKWFPQADLLRHKNIKLFISHGGYQSLCEAVDAGVPLIGIPMASDQWFNTELYLKHEIGVKLDFNTLTKENLKSAIDTVIEDKRYRENIIRLRNLINDQPQSPLERAVWWTEHLLRHGGATHLRSAAAHMHWTEYYELKLILTLLTLLLLIVLLLSYCVHLIVRILTSTKIKVN